MKKKIDICLVVGCNNSKEDTLDTINNDIAELVKKIKISPYLQSIDVYFTLASFTDTLTKNVDFVPIDSVSPSSLALKYGNQTNPGPALDYVVQKAYKRYYDWNDNGEEAFCPLFFFFTDGAPYPKEKYMPKYKEAANRIRQLEAQRELVIVCAGYGDANIENLNLLTANSEHVIKMSGNNVDKLSRFFCEIIPRKIGGECDRIPPELLEKMKDLFEHFIDLT